MFEQTLGWENHRTNRSWAVMIGLTWQVALVSLAVVCPLIWPDSLPKGSWLPDWRKPLTPYHGSVELVAVPAHNTPRGNGPARPFDPTSLYAPRKVPDKVAMVMEAPGGGSMDIGYSGPFIRGMELLGTQAPTLVDRLIRSLPVIDTPAPVVPETKVAPREPLRVGGKVQAAKILKQVLPLYPPLARQARVSGVVRLLGIIAKDGSIERLELVSGHALLARAAFDAVRQWVYRPTLLNGEPVEVIAPIDVIFTLNQ